jgi:hypothetical protein
LLVVLRRLALVVVTAVLLSTGIAHAQTNYPVNGTLELTDAQGRSIDNGICEFALVNARANAWAAGSPVKAEYFSDAVQLGTFNANSNGVMTMSFHVPDAEPVPGTHTFRLTGTGSDGQARSIEAAIKCLVCDPSPPSTVPGGGGGGSVVGGGGGSVLGGGDASGAGSQVLGKTLDAPRATDGGAGSLFGKTGSDLVPIFEIGAALLAVGAALVLAVRKRRNGEAFSG